MRSGRGKGEDSVVIASEAKQSQGKWHEIASACSARLAMTADTVDVLPPLQNPRLLRAAVQPRGDAGRRRRRAAVHALPARRALARGLGHDPAAARRTVAARQRPDLSAGGALPAVGRFAWRARR